MIDRNLVARNILATTALLSICCGNAAAEVTPRGSGTLAFTDNVFRLPESTAVQPGDARADATARINVGGSLRSEEGNWTLTGDAEVNRLAFARNARLDTTGYRLEAAAEHRTAVANGSLLVQWTRQLTPFSDVRTFAASRQQVLVATGNYSRNVLGDFRLIGSVDYLRSVNSSRELRGNDVARTSFGGGAGYFSPTGNILAVQADLRDATGLNAVPVVANGRAGDYRSSSRETRVYARLHLEPSALLQFDGEFGYARHDDRSLFDGDFSGSIWNAVSSWTPRPAVRMRAALRRAFEAEDGLYTNGLAVRSADLSIDADLTARLTLRGMLGLRDRNFRFDPLAQAAPRNDRYVRAALTAGGDIGRIARLEVTAAREKRTATLLDQRYKSFTLTTTLVVRPSR